MAGLKNRKMTVGVMSHYRKKVELSVDLTFTVENYCITMGFSDTIKFAYLKKKYQTIAYNLW